MASIGKEPKVNTTLQAKESWRMSSGLRITMTASRLSWRKAIFLRLRCVAAPMFTLAFLYFLDRC
jgi:hypothetical protein